MKNLKIKNLILYSSLLYTLVILSFSKPVFADTISTGGGNKIHFINLKSKSGSDAILLESNGHFGLIDMGEDYDFPDGSNPLYPDRWGISRANEDTIEDRLFRHLKQVGVKKLDFILGTHVHSDHIGTADEVLKRYPVDRFYLKKYSDERITTQWRLWDNLYNYDNAVRTALERGVTLIQDISDQDSHFKLGNMDIQLYNYKNEYGPDGKLKRVYDDNSNSIVAVVNVAGKKIYLGGDLDNDQGAEDRLGPVIGKVDMMKWNHHYDATISNTVNFIENLSPSIVVQTSGADINRQSTTNLLREKNIQTIKAYSKTKDATVFDISDSGFSNVSDSFPDIPTVSEKWYKEDGYWKYRLSDDQMAIGWKKINGVYYFFNGQVQMQADIWLHLKDSKEKIDGNWYYLNKDGSMQESGWFKHDGTWYYITWSGARTYNELVEIGGKKYLFDKDGKMLTGSQVFNGKKMFFASSGALEIDGTGSGWKKIESNWYYFDEEGKQIVGKKEINGLTYYFDNKGVMQTGWALIEGHWNYFANSGAMKTGWIKDKDTWYYLDKEGIMQTGLKEIEGTRYYLNASGAMQIGWAFIEGHWKYFATSGAMQTGWLKEQGLWYYLDKEGIMQTGLKEIEGTRYYLNASGVMQTGWKWFDNHYSYFTSSGAMKIGWLKENRLWYYLDTETGQMVTGIHKVNDETYYFDANGAMQTGWKQLDGKWYYFQADGSLLRNGTTPDGYKVNAEGVWTTSKSDETTKETKVEHKQGKVTETTQVVTKETNTETNSSVVIEKNQAPEPVLETTEEKN